MIFISVEIALFRLILKRLSDFIYGLIWGIYARFYKKMANSSQLILSLKVAFFQISKSPKKYSEKTILNLKFKFPAKNTLLLLAGNLNVKLKIVFWNIFFGDWEI